MAHVPATLLVLSGVVCILSILNEFYNSLIAASVKLVEPEKYPNKRRSALPYCIETHAQQFPTTLRPKFPLYSDPHDSVTKSGVGIAGADITRELHNTQVAHARQLMGAHSV